MTSEEKELLFKDLCARLPYGVKCLVNYTICNETTDYNDVPSSTVDTITTINRQTESYFFEWLSEWFDCDEFKPYLFPMSSMTEEQRKYISDRWGVNEDFDFEIDPNWGRFFVELGDVLGFINWCYENHLDINGLIPKDSANDATGLNIYKEE